MKQINVFAFKVYEHRLRCTAI